MTEITINLHDQPCGNCTICIGRTIGAKHEQERIIKLLESTADCRCTPNNPDWDNTCFCDAIELIKGETNERL